MADKKRTYTPMMIGTSKKQTRTDKEMDHLLQKYLEKNPDHDGPLDPDEICGWAIDHGIYIPPPPVTPRDQLRRRFSRHLSHRYITDPQSREVKALHPVPYEEMTPDGIRSGFRYYPLFTTPPERIRVSFKWRSDQALYRVVQIEQDRLSYNDNNVFGATIEQLSFNYDLTLAEREMPTTWSEEAPEGIDDEDDES